MKKISLCVLSLLLVLWCCSCEEENKISSTQVMMDTVITVTLWDSDQETLNGAIELCRELEQVLSRTIETSDVSKINTDGTATVSSDTIRLLEQASEISQKSNGAFDITILPLVELWDINNASQPPDSSAIRKALESVNYKLISVDGYTVTSNGAEIDLGGIAKGYIADRVREYLISKGVQRAIINLGGNVSVLGTNGGKDYSVGIQKPFALHGESTAILMLSDKTAVTSGIYERYFEYDGRIYHHIIDPKTGYPVNNGIQSVTVITDNSSVADSLSTACLVLGLEDGMRLAKQFDAETVFILESGEIRISDGLKFTTDTATDSTPIIEYK